MGGRLTDLENAVAFNCRRWIELVITQKLIPRGWASRSITSIHVLLSTPRDAAQKSEGQTDPAFVEYKP